MCIASIVPIVVSILQSSKLSREAARTPYTPPVAARVEPDYVPTILSVDDLYEAAELTEEEEWELRAHIARGRAKLFGGG